MRQTLRYSVTLGAALSLLLVLFGTSLPVSRAAPPTTPILLVVNDAGPSKFGRYLGEILRAEGLNNLDVMDISGLTAAALAQHDLAVLAQTPLTSDQAITLTNYVSGGGRLLAMRPDAQIKGMFGLGTASGVLNDGYLKINDSVSFNGVAPGQGLVTATLQIHGGTDQYSVLSGAAVIAQLYSDATNATAYPAVIGSNYGTGQAAAFTYDLAQNVIYTRQGNPANANIDVDGDGITRTIDLFQTIGGGTPWVDRNRIPVPQADEQQRLFARLVQQLVSNVRPLPQLWYFPDTAKTMLILTGDAHANPTSYYQNEINSLNSHGGKITFYMSIASNPADASVQAWRAQGNEFGIHPYAYKQDPDPSFNITSLAQGYDMYTGWFSSTFSSPQSRTVRNHQVVWQGWTDAADIAVAHGIALDTNFYNWGPWLKKPDGTWPHGYITGSGQAMKFIRADGTLLPIYQQLTQLVDEHLLGAISPNLENLSGAQAIGVSRQLIDASQAGDYAALMTQNHVDYYGYGDPQVWAEGTLDYARSLGVPIWNADQWLSFVETRHDANYGGVAWDGTAGSLTFNLSANATPGITLTTLLPLTYGARGLQSVTVDGVAQGFSVQNVKGTATAFVSVPAGNHSFNAVYQVGAATPTNTPTPTPTPVVSVTPTVTPTVSATPTATVTPPGSSITHTTFSDFGQFCAVLTDTYVSDLDGGAVALAAAFADNFPGTSLDASRWLTGTWGTGVTTQTVSGSVLTIQGNGWARSQISYTHGTFEAVAQFAGGSSPSQHIGFANADFAGNRYFIFSSMAGDGNLYARVNNNATEQTVNLGPMPTGLHRYRIEWGASTPTTDTVSFYLDGVFQTAMDVDNTGAAFWYAYLSNDTAAGALTVDQAQVTPPYLTSGSYTSCVLDAGAMNAWQTIRWDAILTTTTTLTVETRTSSDSVTWGGWITVSVSGGSISPLARYAQYRLLLATNDTQTTPVVNSVTLDWVPIADLAISKTASPEPVTAGTVLTYTLVITNNGPADANSVQVIDTLPSGVTFVSATPTLGACSQAGGLVDCGIGTLSSSAVVTVTVTLSVSASAPAGAVTNSASVSAATADPNASNNSASVTTHVQTRANLGIAQVHSPIVATAGNVLVYTVTIANIGPSDAAGVTVTDTLPTGVIFGTAISSQGTGCSGTSTVVCNLNDLANGATATVTLAITPTEQGIISNTVSVASDTLDPDLTNNSVTQSTTVSHAGVDHIVLSPVSATRTAGTAVTYTTTAYDVFSNSWDVTTDPGTAYAITAGAGGVWTSNVYTSANAGAWIVTATYQTKLATAALTVNHAAVDHIVLSPASATRTAGTAVTYTATAYDVFSNTWDVTTDPGTVYTITTGASGTWVGNVYTSANAGVWTVTATYQTKSATAGLTVNHAAVDHIVLSPASATRTAGTAVTYTTIAYDVFSNSWDVTTDPGTAYTITTGAGGMWVGNVYTSANAGAWTVTATYQTKSATAALTVDRAAVDHIALSPASATRTAGTTVTYTTTAYDMFSNSWDVTTDPGTAYTITTGAGGMWAGNVYTSANAGAWTVTATYQTKSATAGLAVNHTGVDQIVLSPAAAARTAGMVVTYTTTAYDVFSNSWDVTTDPGTAYTITAGAGGAWAGNVYTSANAGAWTVTATYQTKSATAALTVNRGAPYTLTLQADPISLIVGSSSVLTATVSDQFGNPVPDGTDVTFVADEGNVETPSATANGIATSIISSTVAGTAHITATSGSTQHSTTIVFTPGAPSQIIVLASPSTLVAGSGATAAITATVSDVFGNVLSGVVLTGDTLPSTLGSVSGLGATDTSGQAFGVWTAGSLPGSGLLRVDNGNISGTLPVTLAVPISSAAPTITSLSTDSVAVGGAGFTLVVTGTNFNVGSVVYWNGVPQTTTFVNSTQLTITVPAAALAAPGTVNITVVNPGPAGTSNVVTLKVWTRIYLPAIFGG